MDRDEMVLCVARRDMDCLFSAGLPQGGFVGPAIEDILSLPLHFIPRGTAEADPAFKQVIPYQLFCVHDHYFVFRRGAGVGESRLAGRLSTGVGGHINSSDRRGSRFSLEDFYRALEREREEELLLDGSYTCRFCGWINDDSDPVGQVHLGAVFLTGLESRSQIAIRPDGEDLLHEGWFRAEEIMARRAEFEKWSVMAVALVKETLMEH